MDHPDLNKPAFKIYPAASAAISDNKCPTCGRIIGSFRNAISKKEYSISGMCQVCQDEVFGKD